MKDRVLFKKKNEGLCKMFRFAGVLLRIHLLLPVYNLFEFASFTQSCSGFELDGADGPPLFSIREHDHDGVLT